MSEKTNNCDQVFPFFLQELSPEASKAFAEHTQSCPECAEELQGLQQVWQTLPYEMEEIEVPEQLKSRMLDNIMQNINDYEQRDKEQPSVLPVMPIQQPSLESGMLLQSGKKTKRWSFAAAAVLYVAIGAALGWGLKDYGDSSSAEPPPSLAPSLIAQPAQVVKQFTLKAFDPGMPEASGKCFIKQQGDTKQLVLQVNGLNKNSGDWAYQVWLVKEGVRYNGGTFRVNDKGDGVLTYDLPAAESSFETLGITLEPDSQGTKPRGKKVLGT
jgi:hypothetical protein